MVPGIYVQFYGVGMIQRTQKYGIQKKTMMDISISRLDYFVIEKNKISLICEISSFFTMTPYSMIQKPANAL